MKIEKIIISILFIMIFVVSLYGKGNWLKPLEIDSFPEFFEKVHIGMKDEEILKIFNYSFELVLLNKYASQFPNLPIYRNSFDSDSIKYKDQRYSKGLQFYKNILLEIGIVKYHQVDKNNKIISAVHSGWRGTKHKITSKAISILQNQYGSNPNDILVYISPCAGENDYEIGADVAQYFPNHIRQIERSKYLFDLGGAVFDELLSNGIPAKNIEFNRISTISNNNYHSYRREKEKSGRMGLFILMK